MRIGEVARLTATSERLLRYYEEQGLLHPARLANGYRDYSDDDVVAVRHVRSLLVAGLPTAVIARLLPCLRGDGDRFVTPTCPEGAGYLRQEHGRVLEGIARLQTSRRSLETLLAVAEGHPARDD